MNRTASLCMLFAVVLGASSPAIALPSPVVRDLAQRLGKIEEDMADADPNVALAALQQAALQGTPAEREKALSLGLASSDTLIKGLALKLTVCSTRSLIVRYDPGYVSSSTAVLNGLTPVSIDKCDLATGTFSTEGPNPIKGGPERFARDPRLLAQLSTSDGGRVSGANLSLSFSWGNGGTQTCRCTGSFQLVANGVLVGQMACAGNLEKLKMTAAEIRLR